MTLTSKLATKGQHEMVLTRTFAAPRALVFRAWTEPQHLAQWWGPRGFTNPVCEFDARPGGQILIDMAGPDGTIFPMTGTVHEVAAPERLVFTSRAMEDEAGNALLEVHNTVTFIECDGQTTVTVRAVVVKVAPEMAGALAGMNEGWAQSLDKLTESLGGTDSSDREFLLSRTFDAPRTLVFKAWTEAERLAKWWGPKGFTMLACKLDLRPGGVFHYGMKAPNGGEMWGKWVFRDVTPPERLVFVASFADAQGNTTRAPFSADWPLEVLSTVTFTERAGKTTLTMRAMPVNVTEAERALFASMHASMTGGWTGTLDQLAAFLSQG